MKLCSKCRERPALSYHAYCYECKRESRGLSRQRVRKAAPSPEICPQCGVRPKLDYHNWCRECKNGATAKWHRHHLGYQPRQVTNARQYAYKLLLRGKIARGPCVFCGDPGAEFHHYDYEPRTRNFDDVCTECHDAAHIILKILLTAAFGRV